MIKRKVVSLQRHGLQVYKLSKNMIFVSVITEKDINKKIYIPRMNLMPSNLGLLFKF